MAEFTDPSPAKSYSFFGAMLKAVTSPKQATFHSLAQDPNASAGKGFLWIGIFGAVSSLIIILLLQVFTYNPMLDYLYRYGSDYLPMPIGSNIGSILLSLLCGVPATAVLSVIGLAIGAGFLHLIAKLLGGTGEYGKLVYLLALISIPFSLISSILAPIPWVGCITFLITIYVLVLEILAIEAVYQFGIAKAALTLFIPVLIVCCLVACVATSLGLFFATVFRETFQNWGQW